jgi:hypothetical protein
MFGGDVHLLLASGREWIDLHLDRLIVPNNMVAVSEEIACVTEYAASTYDQMGSYHHHHHHHHAYPLDMLLWDY